jgi:hypothetical protein
MLLDDFLEQIDESIEFSNEFLLKCKLEIPRKLIIDDFLVDPKTFRLIDVNKILK